MRRVLGRHPSVASIDSELRIVVDPGGLLDLHSVFSSRWSPYHADRALNDFVTLTSRCRSSSRSRLAARAARRLGGSLGRYADHEIGSEIGIERFDASVEALVRALSIGRSRGSWVGSPPYRARSWIYETRPHSSGEVSDHIGAFTDALFSDHSVTHWIDDTPTSICHAVQLIDTFPRARIVHAHRDPRDVVASFRRTTWGGRNVALIASRVASVYRRWFEQRRLLPDHCFVEIRLEHLVENPAKSLGLVCEKVGLDDELLGADAMSILGVSAANGGRHRRELSRADLEVVETELAFAITEYGYER